MKKLYMMMDDTLNVCITVDKYIVLYKEYTYTDSILSILYAKLAAHKIDEAVVITKGILSTQNFNESYKVFNFNVHDSEYSCFVSRFDINKIYHLLEVANIKNIRFIDKAGYYVALNKKNCAIVDTLGNAYTVVTFLNKIRDINYNKYSNLERVLINCNKKFAINDYIDMTTFYDKRFLKYFKNINYVFNKVNEVPSTESSDYIKVLSNLSAFAYAELPISKYFELDNSIINLINANPIRKEDEYNEFNSDEVDAHSNPIIQEPIVLDNDLDNDLDNNLDNDNKNSKKKKFRKKSNTGKNSKGARDSKGAKNSKDARDSKGARDLDKKNQQESKYKQKQKRRNDKKEKKANKKKASKPLIAANLLCILVSICIFGLYGFSVYSANTFNAKSVELDRQKAELEVQMSDINDSIMNYSDFENTLNQNINNAKMYEALTKCKINGDIDSVSFQSGSMMCNLLIKDTTKDKKVVKTVDNTNTADTNTADTNNTDSKSKDKKIVTVKGESIEDITDSTTKALAKKLTVQSCDYTESANIDGYLGYTAYVTMK